MFNITAVGHAPSKCIVDRFGLFLAWTDIASTVSLLRVTAASRRITIELRSERLAVYAYPLNVLGNGIFAYTTH